MFQIFILFSYNTCELQLKNSASRPTTPSKLNSLHIFEILICDQYMWIIDTETLVVNSCITLFPPWMHLIETNLFFMLKIANYKPFNLSNDPVMCDWLFSLQANPLRWRSWTQTPRSTGSEYVTWPWNKSWGCCPCGSSSCADLQGHCLCASSQTVFMRWTVLVCIIKSYKKNKKSKCFKTILACHFKFSCPHLLEQFLNTKKLILRGTDPSWRFLLILWLICRIRNDWKKF